MKKTINSPRLAKSNSHESQFSEAEKIQNLNKNKEYVLFSSALLKEMFADTNLNAQQLKCWQLLYDLAKFNKNLEVKISYYQICKMLNRSKRTVIRYLSHLTLIGYINTIHNIDYKNNTHFPNTFEVRVPFYIFDKLKNLKNRNNKLKVQIDDNQAKLSSGENINIKINNNNTLTTFNKENLGEKSNSLLFSSFEKEIQHQINLLSEEKGKLNQALKNNTLPSEEAYAALRKISENDSKILFLQETQEQQIKKTREKEKMLNQEKTLTENPYWTAMLTGERSVGKATVKKAVVELTHIGYPPAEAHRLTNEIIYETRFGSLRESKIDKKPLSAEHALHIGLKLIREKRWNKPKTLEAMLQQA
jgi:hypothetical protein